MEFNKNKANNRQQTNVNTRGIQLMNKDGFDPSTVVLGFWNDMMSIKLHPALEPSKQTQTAVYDYETTFQTVLNVEKGQLLLNKIKEKILPALESETEASVGVLIGDDSLLLVGTGVKQFNEVKPFLGLFKGLNEKKKAETMICFEFKATETINDYDPMTGEHDVEKDSYPHLDLFVKYLESGISALMHAETHSIRHVDKYYRDTLLAAVKGTDVSSSSNGYSSGSRTRNIFGDNSSSSTPSFESEVSKEHVDDINSFLN